MHSILTLLLLVGMATSTSAADKPAAAVITESQQGGFNHTISERMNGCRLDLSRYTQTNPHLQGYWIDNVYEGNTHILRIIHNELLKEQTLEIQSNTGYGIVQIDRKLNGKYDLFVIIRLKDLRLMDVLTPSKEGWLRHGTQEEYESRFLIYEANRKGFEKIKKVLDEINK